MVYHVRQSVRISVVLDENNHFLSDPAAAFASLGRHFTNSLQYMGIDRMPLMDDRDIAPTFNKYQGMSAKTS